jgi:hypothetical protein
MNGLSGVATINFDRSALSPANKRVTHTADDASTGITT